MAKMIPTQIVDDGVSSGERRIFTLLKEDPATTNWTALHSLGLARREGGPYGEFDYYDLKNPISKSIMRAVRRRLRNCLNFLSRSLRLLMVLANTPVDQ